MAQQKEQQPWYEIIEKKIAFGKQRNNHLKHETEQTIHVDLKHHNTQEREAMLDRQQHCYLLLDATILDATVQCCTPPPWFNTVLLN